ncbi:MAG: hypothetical protein V3575_00410 [Candidatus Absconditabacteria bacterium]
MRDNVVRVLRFVIGGSLIGYLIKLYTSNAIITDNENMQMFFYIIVFCIGLYILAFAIYPICLPKPKTTNVLFGIFIIIFAASSLKDNPQNNVYIADILKIVGIMFTIAGFTKVLIPASCQKKMEDAKIEIIEV